MYYFSVDTYNNRTQWRICKFVTNRDNIYKTHSNRIQWRSSKLILAYVPS